MATPLLHAYVYVYFLWYSRQDTLIAARMYGKLGRRKKSWVAKKEGSYNAVITKIIILVMPSPLP